MLSRLLAWTRPGRVGESGDEALAPPAAAASHSSAERAECLAVAATAAGGSGSSDPAPDDDGGMREEGAAARPRTSTPARDSVEPAPFVGPFAGPSLAARGALTLVGGAPLNALGEAAASASQAPSLQLERRAPGEVTGVDEASGSHAASQLPSGPWPSHEAAEIALKAHALTQGFVLRRATGMRNATRCNGEKVQLTCQCARTRASIATQRKTKKFLAQASAHPACGYSIMLEQCTAGWTIRRAVTAHSHALGESLDARSALAVATAKRKLPPELAEMGKALRASGQRTVDVHRALERVATERGLPINFEYQDVYNVVQRKPQPRRDAQPFFQPYWG
ncbi:hypothetical protein KFE25_007798 [Diacronema lutheri]|uniref:FAR1 domain-containing protein n=1 Tax=Diacronema lutheri TaxID=2081491 RepID=A0A8J6CGM5_DIALT|nr:hypothetical protein KFE25_007798 [Diacronema lutheri]